MSSVVENLRLAQIRIDGETQSRAEINNEVVAEYAEALTEGEKFPPIIVFFDGASYWLADGFHRRHAHEKIGALDIAAEVRDGTQLAARIFSHGANKSHGLRRTNADKKKAVLGMLRDAPEWSDNRIAKHVGVHHSTVGEYRRSLANSASDEPQPRTYTTKHGTAAVMNTENIGKKKDVAPAPAKKQARTLEAAPLPEEQMNADDELAEAHHTIADLASEVDQLRDQLAIKQMDASEAEKQHAAGTIADLRRQVKALEEENATLKVSRDTYMRENAQLKIQCNSQRRALQKLQREAA